ncbi:FG-GAP-like repeat-containing protein [Streptomyces bambusae]|uniref:FG-GAP-like repeat-containing protein n=1 Tax=Streptomyces bambusae TaxID=1550616 RepID=UPI001CFE8E24|nr:FG-GAP-like repeat-containing protein [Streptomyces bambusae]MCB5169033.1 FG-GAP-like repeat-containing protein [Streptomyces bambusae]
MRPKTHRAAVTALAAVTLALAAPAAPAAAASGFDRCAWGNLCLFSGPVGEGDMLVVKSGGRLDLGTWNNRASSFANYTEHPVCFHKEPALANPLASTHFYVGSGTFDETAEPDFDNNVSSFDLGPEADQWCGGESRFPVFQYDGPAAPRPAPVPAEAAFGDLNGDGWADLAGRNKFGQLWSSNSYESGAKEGVLVGAGWNAMTKLTRHGDHNGDGREDLYARDTAGVLWFYPGTGTGTFGTRVKIGAGWNTMADLAAAGDLTGDGRRDLLAADTTGVLWTYPGNGKGGFGTRTKVGAGWKVMNELVGAGDLNGDRRSDLVARDTTGRLWLYPGNGKAAFGARKLIGTGGWNGLTELTGAGDVTGDGRPDLVAHHRKDNTLRVYPGAAGGALKAPATLAGVPDPTFVF